LKPTFGEIGLDGAVPLSRSLDHAGPLASTVTDAWHLYRALLGGPADAPIAAMPAAELRVGVLRDYFCDVLDDEVRGRFEEALVQLRRGGVAVEERAIERTELIVPSYMHISFAEAAAYHARTIESVPHLYTPPVRQRIELARYVMAEDYVRAMEVREILRRGVSAALDRVTVLVLPTLPIPAPPIGASTVEIRGRHEPVRALMLRLTQLFNLTGHPAVSIPCGTTAAGLPCGLQLVGRAGGTETLLSAALAAEQLLS
jgi:aspartyl-tRNA(Asn)/glutamyl-tRNA(Gln) amidotransferase subunit A